MGNRLDGISVFLVLCCIQKYAISILFALVQVSFVALRRQQVYGMCRDIGNIIS